MRCLKVFLCVFLCSSCVLAQGYDNDEIEVDYGDVYYNEIPDNKEEATSAPCTSKDLTKWDKLFSMLENSQMKENMLLQYVNDIITVELQSMRAEMLQFVGTYASTCTNAMDSVSRRIASQVDQKLAQISERTKDANKMHQSQLEQLLLASRNQASKLSKLESTFQNGAEFKAVPSEPKIQDVPTSVKLEKTMNSIARDLQITRAQLDFTQRWTNQHFLPSGCEMALLFPMRSKKIFASVNPEAAMTLRSFTVCFWAKVTEALNKTVLFSYGTKRNPYDIQLSFSQTSAVFTVGGEASSVETPNVVENGQWGHFCGTWSSEEGSASLWVNGELAVTSKGVAKGYTIPDGGVMQLGQERNGCCVSGLNVNFDDKLAFSGKMTGINLWDRVLQSEQILQLARENDSCSIRGNVVGWGVTEIIPHGGAQYTF
nr:PREDICTED: pentraxin-related protein PTX3 [Lepisosteus oculatus]